MRTPRTRSLLAVVVAALAGFPASASAASLVFIRNANVWVSSPDGSQARQITSDGTASMPYMSPSEDDQGVIVAQRGSIFFRLDQNGRPLGTIPTIFTGKPAAVTAFGPFSPRVSPDGRLVAYYVGYLSGSYDPDCNCTLSSDEEDVIYARTDGSGPIGASRWWRSPSWADNRHVILAAPDNRQTAQVGVADVTTLGNSTTATGWFQDDGAGYGYMVNLDQPELARSLDRLALVRGMASERLALYSVAPTGSATDQCELTQAAGSYQRPAWAPDGSALTFADDHGVWSMPVGSDWQQDCASLTPTLILPGASDAGWSPASLPPPQPTGSPGGNGGPGGPSSGSAGGNGPNAGSGLTGVRVSVRTLSHHSGLVVTIRPTVAASLRLTLSRCQGPICRTLATARRASAAQHTLTLRRRLQPGRYRIVITVTTGSATAHAQRTIRVS